MVDDGSGHGRTRTQREDELKKWAWREAGYEVLRFADPVRALPRIGRLLLNPKGPS